MLTSDDKIEKLYDEMLVVSRSVASIDTKTHMILNRQLEHANQLVQVRSQVDNFIPRLTIVEQRHVQHEKDIIENKLGVWGVLKYAGGALATLSIVTIIVALLSNLIKFV